MVPQHAVIESYAKAEGLEGTFEELVKNEKVRRGCKHPMVQASRAHAKAGTSLWRWPQAMEGVLALDPRSVVEVMPVF